MVVHRSIELHQEAAMGTFAIMNDLILAVLSFIFVLFFSYLLLKDYRYERHCPCSYMYKVTVISFLYLIKE